MTVPLRAVALCAGLLLVAAAPAAGAFPGANGKIVFVSSRDHSGLMDEIYVANADGSSPTRLTHDGGYSAPTFSPDGTRIAYGSRSGHIFVMDADGTDRVQLTSAACGGNDPAFSPDGLRIAFVVRNLGDCPGEHGMIAAMDADGENRSASGRAGSGPAWAPDGTRIAFTCGAHICTMSPAGGDLHLLTDGYAEADPNYSPDGSRIVYTSFFPNGLSEIYVMDADGSDPRRLTFNDSTVYPTFDLEPVFSPDGMKIAYYSGTYGPRIHVMNADGTDIRPLTCAAAGTDRSPNWGLLAAPSDAGSGVFCDADFDDDGVNNPFDACPLVPGPGGFLSGCPALVPPPPSGGTGSGTPGGTGGGGPGGSGVGPAVDRLLASVAQELAQAGMALTRCGTTGLLRRAGCRDFFRGLGPGFVAYRVTAPAAGSRAAAVTLLASGRRAIPAAGSYPVKVKATKKGRKRLRKAGKLRATLAVTFTDSTGNVAKRSKKVVLRRKKK